MHDSRGNLSGSSAATANAAVARDSQFDTPQNRNARRFWIGHDEVPGNEAPEGRPYIVTEIGNGTTRRAPAARACWSGARPTPILAKSSVGAAAPCLSRRCLLTMRGQP